MILSLDQPFALTLTLLEEERRWGSSRFEVYLHVTRFNERLRLNTEFWLENDAWDGFVSQLADAEPGEAVLRDMSK